MRRRCTFQWLGAQCALVAGHSSGHQLSGEWDSFTQESEKLQEAFRDLIYQVLKKIGIVMLVKRIPFLRLRGWVQERESHHG